MKLDKFDTSHTALPASKIGSSFSSLHQINTGTPQGNTISSDSLHPLRRRHSSKPDNDYTKISQYADNIAIWTSHIDMEIWGPQLPAES